MEENDSGHCDRAQAVNFRRYCMGVCIRRQRSVKRSARLALSGWTLGQFGAILQAFVVLERCLNARAQTDVFSAEVIWLGSVFSTQHPTLWSERAEALDLTFEGVSGARHHGTTRRPCVRVTAQYPKGTPIRNERQLSVLSAEELQAIAQAMVLEDIDPARLGASLVLQGIPDFSHVPPSSRLLAPSGASLGIDMENRPCQLPAKSWKRCIPARARARAFAKRRRGGAV